MEEEAEDIFADILKNEHDVLLSPLKADFNLQPSPTIEPENFTQKETNLAESSGEKVGEIQNSSNDKNSSAPHKTLYVRPGRHDDTKESTKVTVGDLQQTSVTSDHHTTTDAPKVNANDAEISSRRKRAYQIISNPTQSTQLEKREKLAHTQTNPQHRLSPYNSSYQQNLNYGRMSFNESFTGRPAMNPMPMYIRPPLFQNFPRGTAVHVNPNFRGNRNNWISPVPHVNQMPVYNQQPASYNNPRITRYFVIKSYNMENLEKSRSHGAWATTHTNANRLHNAFLNSEMVILIFSVNNSGNFQGYCRMTSDIGGAPHAPWSAVPNTSLADAFSVTWINTSNLPFEPTNHLRNPLNENKPVKICRDGQELPAQLGEIICKMLDDTVSGEIRVQDVHQAQQPQFIVQYHTRPSQQSDPVEF
ncbi:hypothetical protein HK098_003595 [Nowakowskiella sp. JEL0407]|nr:hypothetical protein HK098_003595 [Nowakowskiella sp. JEL0407]